MMIETRILWELSTGSSFFSAGIWSEWEKQIAKEAKERQIASQNNDKGRAVSANLHEQQKSEPIRTAAMVAKKIILLQKVEEQVRKEARERQIQAGKEFGRGQEKVTSNLTGANQKPLGETVEIMAAKLNISKNTYKDMKTIVESKDAEKVRIYFVFFSSGLRKRCV